MTETKEIKTSHTYNLCTIPKCKRKNFIFPTALIDEVENISKRWGRSLTRVIEGLMIDLVQRERVIPESDRQKLLQEGLIDEVHERNKKILTVYYDMVIKCPEKTKREIRTTLMNEFYLSEASLRKIIYGKKPQNGENHHH